MKRLLLILVLIFTLVDINPTVLIGTKKLVCIDKEFGTVLIGETTVIAKRPVKPEVPASFIADHIFEKQLYVESRSHHLVRANDSTLRLIKSPAGALGIAQFLPSTWEWLKKRKILPSNFSIENESHQRAAQRIFMNRLAKKDYGIKYNKVKLALASYNAGSGRVRKLIRKHGLEWELHLPRETKRYIKIIMG